MSRYNYEESKKIAAENYQFAAVIMAAVRQADSINFEKLKAAFPEICEELQARYDAPGGLLPGEHKPEATDEP